jgi:hypothetical protein
MALHRLIPASGLPSAKLRGRCAACGKALGDDKSSVRLHGQVFHRTCALYSPGREGGA